MSKANNPIKVLRTALKRVTKGWTKSTWHKRTPDGQNLVCLEGAVYGFCNGKGKATDAQEIAIRTLEDIIVEQGGALRSGGSIIPHFNDAGGTELEDVQEVIKRAIIRLETGGDDDLDFTEEELDELLPSKS